jgi:hypothetical protein
MKSCRKCGTELPDWTLSCPPCGASQSLDALLSVAVMKFLGIVCGIAGVALLVYTDQIDASPHAYVLWLFAGGFIAIGFVMFYRKWAERS